MRSRLDPALTFATFVVGVSNQLALSAARTLAESPRPPFNPLFIVGGAGQGKTHLLHAIGAQRLLVDPGATVDYIRWDEFLAELARENREQTMASFGSTALLLIDDLGGFGTAPAAVRDTAGVILGTRLDTGLPIVCAGSKGPGDLHGDEGSITRRLGGGLVAEVGVPDEALREELVRRRASYSGVSFSAEVVAEVVGLPLGSVRELLGAVSRLTAFQEVSPTPLDPAQARVLVTGDVEPDTAALPSHTVVAAPESEARPEPSAAAGPEASVEDEADEFGSFLSEIVAGVSQQVDRWRARVADAIMTWEAEGIHTARLQALLDQEFPARPEAVLDRFENDVERLRAVAAEVSSVAPDLAEHEALRDPDQLALAERLLDEARTRGLGEFGANATLVLEDLIEVTSNRAALAALREAMEEPGSLANPVLLVGDSGTGKTHVLHGVANHLASEYRVVCLGASAFCSTIAEAERESQTDDWIRRFQWAGALFMDDLHLLAGHPTAQSALVRIFDRMLEANVPVFCTSATPIAALADLSPQLLTRIAGGVVIDLPRPDREFRLALITRLLRNVEGVSDPVLADYLAAIDVGSIREVQGTVKRVLQAAHGEGVIPTVGLARRVIESGQTSRSRAHHPVHAGVLGPTVGGTRLREKMVEQWSEVRELLREALD